MVSGYEALVPDIRSRRRALFSRDSSDSPL
jgi:hypothetical protein